MTRASIVLPTRAWTPACEELLTQVSDEDELFIICDTETDPVTDHVDNQENVQLIISGEPVMCSGKANAVATGLEAASGEIIVCTDADFTHEDGWLETVIDLTRTHGAVSTIPIFRSKRLFGALLEPVYAVLALPVLLGPGQMWGGLMGFERDQIDLNHVVTDLRRTVGDDYTLGEHIGNVTLVRSLTAEVVIDGTFSDVTHRNVRFCRQFLYYTPVVFWTIISGVLSAAAALVLAQSLLHLF